MFEGEEKEIELVYKQQHKLQILIIINKYTFKNFRKLNISSHLYFLMSELICLFYLFSTNCAVIDYIFETYKESAN